MIRPSVRILLLSAFFAVTSVLSGCVQGVCEPEAMKEVGKGSVPFQIYVSPMATKTVNSGFSTEWADRKSTRLNSSHAELSRMPSSA